MDIIYYFLFVYPIYMAARLIQTVQQNILLKHITKPIKIIKTEIMSELVID